MDDYKEFMDCDKKISLYLSKGDFTFGLAKKDISLLKTRAVKLSEEKERRRVELASTGAEIARLWTLLRVPSAERELFQSSFKMNLSMDTLSKGFDELNRLKEIRKTSLGKVISSIRSDILSLWEEAGIEDETERRKEFSLYFEPLQNIEDTAVIIYFKKYLLIFNLNRLRCMKVTFLL